jgi:hypothetical protein
MCLIQGHWYIPSVQRQLVVYPSKGLTAKTDQVIDLCFDTYPLADMVVVVAWHQGFNAQTR